MPPLYRPPSHHGPLPEVKDVLVLVETAHVRLRERLAFLEQVGFVEELRPGPVPIFVMTEVFVALMWEASV